MKVVFVTPATLFPVQFTELWPLRKQYDERGAIARSLRVSYNFDTVKVICVAGNNDWIVSLHPHA